MITFEKLSEIADLFCEMEPRAREIFETLEKMNIHRFNYEKFTYVGFRIAYVDQCIVIQGSYYSRGDGNKETEYRVSFEDFLSDNYLEEKNAKKAAEEAEDARVATLRALEKERREREIYNNLRMKFGDIQ